MADFGTITVLTPATVDVTGYQVGPPLALGALSIEQPGTVAVENYAIGGSTPDEPCPPNMLVGQAWPR